MDSRVVGILGGGQLGRMIVEAANRLNIKTCVLDAEGSPAMQINAQGHGHVYGSFADAKAVRDLALKSDILTIEIEHVNVIALTNVQRETGIDIYPTPETIAIIQDKYLQKVHLVDHGIVVADFRQVERDKESLVKVGRDYGYPFMLKARTQAYDGRGNYLVRYENEIEKAIEELGSRPLYAEKFANFTKELAVMVVRQIDGTVSSYPTTETVHKENICHITYTPARVPDSIRERARRLAERAVGSFDSAGTFGVEMFLLDDGEIVVNEIAPRPHNSGHYTIDACSTSQFESHIRSVLGLPLAPGFTSLRTPDTNAIMLNVLGGDTQDSEMEICRRSLKVPGATLHLYGKSSRKKRKMGHINIVAGSMKECEARLQEILAPEVLSSKPAEISTRINTPLVSIIMGSDSDLPVMSKAADILTKFDIPFELTIVSAHRTPSRMNTFANAAAERGVRVIIAGAGGAAHLPGMVASMTTLPVIGVPVKGSSLDGVDSLYSIVQMPRGVPVATVGVNNATNAGLLAVRIVSISDTDVVKGSTSRLLLQYMLENERQVLKKADKLQEIGYEKYLENMTL